MRDDLCNGAAREVAQRWADAILRLDVAAAAALLAPGAVTRSEATNERFVGQRGFFDYVSGWAAAFPDLRLHTTGIMQGERADTFRVDTHFTGTHEGTFHARNGPIEPTHRIIDMVSSNELTVREGQIQEIHVYMNFPKLLGQLGLTFRAADEPRP